MRQGRKFMAKGTLLVVGASGDVGRGIVAEALASGRKVVAAGRDAARLEPLAREHDGTELACVTGDLASEEGAKKLWENARDAHGNIDDVVVSVQSTASLRQLAETSAEELSASYASNVITHFNAARTFLPLMPENGMLVGIGGGTADFIFPKMADISMGQAALRMLYRGLAKECRTGAQPRELMIVSMVAGESNRDTAPSDWLTDREVGRHVCSILDRPEEFAGPILKLKAREQVGKPED
jgi:NAD(P)-dependent dehydrogenase (short-subunit alcohol dehydrogenase family)